MKAIDYLKETRRMTDDCTIACSGCPLSRRNNDCNVDCVNIEEECPEKAVAIVEKWAKENPRKTYLSVLLEKFPNVPLEEDGTPKICPKHLFGDIAEFVACPGSTACPICWNRECKEE